MKFDHFMRILLMFDLPVISKKDQKNYRDFIKFLTEEGYLRIQLSIYCKLCINKDSAITSTKRIYQKSPSKGDIRFMIITEKQYLSIKSVNNKYSLQEEITTIDRTVMIGGMNDENKE